MELVVFYVSWVLAAACVTAALYNLFKKWVVYVPPNNVMVVVTAGNQMTRKQHGYHLVKWPFEYVVENDWSYRGVSSSGGVATFRQQGPLISTQILNIDTPAYGVKDRSGISVTVDVAFRFRIVDPVVAVTQHHNLYAFLADCVEGATANVINAMDYRDLVGQNALVATRMRAEMESKMEHSGCAIATLLVQKISPNKALGETAERQSIDAQQAEIEQNKLNQQRILDEQRIAHKERIALAEHENRMKEVERQQYLAISAARNARDIALEEKERELLVARQAMEIARAADEVRRMQQETELRPAQLEQEMRLEYIAKLLERGFTSSHIIELVNGVEIAKQMASSLAGSTKMVMSPEHYRQMLTLPLFPISQQ